MCKRPGNQRNLTGTTDKGETIYRNTHCVLVSRTAFFVFVFVKATGISQCNLVSVFDAAGNSAFTPNSARTDAHAKVESILTQTQPFPQTVIIDCI